LSALLFSRTLNSEIFIDALSDTFSKAEFNKSIAITIPSPIAHSS